MAASYRTLEICSCINIIVTATVHTAA